MGWYDEVEYIRKQAEMNNEFFASSLPMIASENVLSPLCKEMLVTDFHGRYAEGTPGNRYYEGCEFFDHVEEKAMDLDMILHAEHTLNASTFSARIAASTLSDMYAGIVSATGTLFGPMHGGASQKVIEMLREIK